MYSGTGVPPIAVGVVVSLGMAGLSPWVTDEGADAVTDADEVGRDTSMGAAEAEASSTGAGFGMRASLVVVCSKSHETPCLEQLPQRG